MSGWKILHLDLADGPEAVAADADGALVVLWWRGLPLGAKALVREELPWRASQVARFAAGLLADQVRARSPALGGVPEAGVDGQPVAQLGLAAAQDGPPLIAELQAWAAAPAPAAEALSVIVCTRDRPQALAACLASLARQHSPPGEILVVDNAVSGSAAAVAARWPKVRYLHAPAPGLSRARNAGIAAAHGSLLAFTDDDVVVPPGWTAELVRGFADPTVQALTGLVLPAELETPAQRAFELELGGFTARYQPLRFVGGRDAGFLGRTRAMGPQVWRIGAGANMAFRRELFARLGGFDERLGAGASGCSEDSEVWYRVLAAGGDVLYEPRAYVFHHHRRTWRELQSQFRAYMRGHVSALVVQGDRYGPSGDVRRIFRQLPAYFVRTALSAIQTLSGWRLALLAAEVRGWAEGLVYLARRRWRRQPPPAPIPLLAASDAAASRPEGQSHV